MHPFSTKVSTYQTTVWELNQVYSNFALVFGRKLKVLVLYAAEDRPKFEPNAQQSQQDSFDSIPSFYLSPCFNILTHEDAASDTAVTPPICDTVQQQQRAEVRFHTPSYVRHLSMNTDNNRHDTEMVNRFSCFHDLTRWAYKSRWRHTASLASAAQGLSRITSPSLS
jgi:hypothetical protein